MPSSLPVPDPSAECHVHKFGGSSLADAARYRLATELIDDDAHTCLVVVSAMQGTTDALLALANAARANTAWHGPWSDWTSGGSGKSGSVRVGLGWRRDL